MAREPIRIIGQRGSVAGAVANAMRQSATRVDLGGGLNRAIGRAARYTDENYHSEALRSLTRHFGYTDLTGELDNIIRTGENGYERRMPVYDEFIRRVRNDFGESVVRRVYRGL